MKLIERKYPADFNQLLKVLSRQTPDRPVLFEYFTNDRLNALLAGKPGYMPPNRDELIRMTIQAFFHAGYDHVTLPARFYPSLKFEKASRGQKASVSQNEGAVITGWESFRSYAWPDPDEGDFSVFDTFGSCLPAGMKFITPGPGGLLENVTDLVGFERMCIMILEDEHLAGAIFNAVGERLLRFYERCASKEAVGALLINDDWGFKTQTVFDPGNMRKYIFPWHRKMVQAAHRAGKPAILHSCGNVYDLMDAIIDELGYDGKHSFEDIILPVEEVYRRWGNRVAILGGIDMDFLAVMTPEKIAARAGELLSMTGLKSYALGSGNSIPAYIPVENYLAMIRVI